MKQKKAHVHGEYTRSLERTYTGKTLTDIYRQMGADLSVGGPRGLRAIVVGGGEIRCSLYDGESYIKDRRGRYIYKA